MSKTWTRRHDERRRGSGERVPPERVAKMMERSDRPTKRAKAVERGMMMQRP